MKQHSPYIRLMRLHQPTGIWLLLWPCLWSIGLASHGLPDMKLVLLFTFGAVIMRGAGCVVNDLWDRDIDKQVIRTQQRPLASGELTVIQALLFLAVLLSFALIIMLQLNRTVWVISISSLFLVFTYPLMKRITWWPQAFLGLTFNIGALMGWAAVTAHVELVAILLYMAGLFWTLGYDTIYAHQDKRDDERIGVKSTARKLGGHTRLVVGIFYICTFTLLVLAGWFAKVSVWYYAGVALFASQLMWQVVRVDVNDPKDCMRVFRSNGLAGGLVFIGIVAG